LSLIIEINLFFEIFFDAIGHEQNRQIESFINHIAEQIVHAHVPFELSFYVRFLDFYGHGLTGFQSGFVDLGDGGGSYWGFRNL
jgi:hypothetical protein